MRRRSATPGQQMDEAKLNAYWKRRAMDRLGRGPDSPLPSRAERVREIAEIIDRDEHGNRRERWPGP